MERFFLVFSTCLLGLGTGGDDFQTIGYPVKETEEFLVIGFREHLLVPWLRL